MRIEIVPGDITRQRVDVIVNAANSALLGGGGVDGAIHAAAGPDLLKDCRRVRATTHPDGLPVGQAVATGAGRLPATWVVHTVGPNRHRGQNDPALLASCFVSSLRLSSQLGARSVAFPAVSAGVYGWDVTEVAAVAVDAVRSAIAGRDAVGIEVVRFVPFGPAAAQAFEQALGNHRRVVDLSEPAPAHDGGRGGHGMGEFQPLNGPLHLPATGQSTGRANGRYAEVTQNN